MPLRMSKDISSAKKAARRQQTFESRNGKMVGMS